MLKKEFDHLEVLRVKRRQEIMDRIAAFQYTLSERMDQIEYQNKTILKYLKKIEEKRQ
jgi:hypothetical protein